MKPKRSSKAKPARKPAPLRAQARSVKLKRRAPEKGLAELALAMTAAAGPMTLSALAVRSRGSIRASYDSAQTNDGNSNHWAQADALSAKAANSEYIRVTLRKRSRYEIANNTYARGIVLTLTNYVIGTGPRLQLSGDDPRNSQIESEWDKWSRATGLPEKLRTAKSAKTGDGESFLLLVNNPAVQNPVKVDVRDIESDMVSSNYQGTVNPNEYEGLIFDEPGNVTAYRVAKVHPGDGTYQSAVYDAETIPASRVIHWFRCDRPGQIRGIPEITPALPLFAQLRRYTLATIQAAETAADFAMVIQTNLPPNSEAAAVKPMDAIDLERGMMTSLPEGWVLSQVKAEQPTTGYKEFKREILTEIARCVNMPANLALGDSSGYNYASGRLDHQSFFKQLEVERDQCETVVLDRIFAAWFAEAAMIFGWQAVPTDHQWHWDGIEHVDPQKEASAQQIKLQSNTTTLAAEYAKQGKDWETEIRQRAKEVAILKELDLSPAHAAPAQPQPSTDKPITPDDEEVTDDTDKPE